LDLAADLVEERLDGLIHALGFGRRRLRAVDP